MNIHVHIERLVLDSTGLERRDAGAVKLAVEAQLQQLIEQGGAPPAFHEGGDAFRLRTDAVHFSAGDDARAWGAHIARAVHGMKR